jgi:hypothetical protein
MVRFKTRKEQKNTSINLSDENEPLLINWDRVDAVVSPFKSRAMGAALLDDGPGEYLFTAAPI